MLTQYPAECDVPVPGIVHFLWYWQKLVPEKSFGTGIGKIWYRKKVLNRYREKLVPELNFVAKIF